METKYTKVSVIIPVYNREKYISRCIDSVLASTFSNLEIIIVDDGSFDNSLSICEAYAKKDKRIIIISKKNEGAGFARNAGLDTASGNFVFFLDSDDFIDNTAIEVAVEAIVRTNSDIAMLNFQCVDSDEVFINEGIESTIAGSLEIWNEFDFWEHCYTGDLVWCIMPGGKLYKRDIFDGVRYKKMYYEDEMIASDLISKTSKLVVINKKLYFYRIHNTNTMSIMSGLRYLDKVTAFQYRANKFLSERNEHLGESLLWMMNSICFLEKYKKEIGKQLVIDNYLAAKNIVQKSSESEITIKPYIKERMETFVLSLAKYNKKYNSKRDNLIHRIFMRIHKLLSKMKRFFQIKKALKKAKFFLENGYYYVNDRYFVSTNKRHGRFFKTFKVQSKQKLITPKSSLYFVVTKFKTICITNEKAFFFYNDAKRFLNSKKTYEQHHELLPYKHPKMSFIDRSKLSISDVVVGKKYKNHEKFDEVVDILFEASFRSHTIEKIIEFGTTNCTIPFAIQHGDFKDSNIIWSSATEYAVIDLETVDYYPILFDLLFYVLISKTKDSDKILLSDNFAKKVRSIYSSKTKVFFKNNHQYVDYALSCYLLFLLGKYKKEHTFGFFDYYLYWTIFPFIQNKSFECTNRLINDYLTNDKYYNLRGKKII